MSAITSKNIYPQIFHIANRIDNVKSKLENFIENDKKNTILVGFTDWDLLKRINDTHSRKSLNIIMFNNSNPNEILREAIERQQQPQIREMLTQSAPPTTSANIPTNNNNNNLLQVSGSGTGNGSGSQAQVFNTDTGEQLELDDIDRNSLSLLPSDEVNTTNENLLGLSLQHGRNLENTPSHSPDPIEDFIQQHLPQ